MREASSRTHRCAAAIVIEFALSLAFGDAWPDFAGASSQPSSHCAHDAPLVAPCSHRPSVLLALQFINGTLSFYEANKAGNAVAALKASLKPVAVVKRDGAWSRIRAGDIVPGDLVKLDAGAHVPADCRLCGDAELQVDQSALTGESMPVTLRGPAAIAKKEAEKALDVPHPRLAGEAAAGDTAKMGSTVSRGEGEAVVVATGKNTFFGRTASLISSVDEMPRCAPSAGHFATDNCSHVSLPSASRRCCCASCST